MFSRAPTYVGLGSDLFELPHFPEMFFAISRELFKIFDWYTHPDAFECLFCSHPYSLEKAEYVLKAALVEDKHDTIPAHAIYFCIEEHERFLYAIIAPILPP